MDENLRKECMHFDLPPERNSVKPQVSAIDHLPNGSILINGMYTVTEQKENNTVEAIPNLDSLYIPNYIDAQRIPE